MTTWLQAVWVGLSGGLHLDGLADTADAWIGGHADRQRTLEIMKDPRSGPIAVVVLLLVLLLKFAALVVLLGQGAWAGLLLAPWLGRALQAVSSASNPRLPATIEPPVIPPPPAELMTTPETESLPNVGALLSDWTARIEDWLRRLRLCRDTPGKCA